ncbi:MAG: glutathione S-transferase family protein, partial [Hyphomicrobiaceae bacterium]
LSKFEHHEAWYKELNSSGIVPCLLVDGRPLVESNFINEWIDETFPDPPLMPADPFERHEVRLWGKFVDDKCLYAIQKFNWMHRFHPIAREWSDEELERRLAAIPTEERRKTWYRMARDPYNEEELDVARKVLFGMLDEIDTRVDTTGFVVGNRYSLADIAAAPYAVRVENIWPEAYDARPSAKRWWNEVKNRPAYARAEFGSYDELAARDQE